MSFVFTAEFWLFYLMELRLEEWQTGSWWVHKERENGRFEKEAGTVSIQCDS